MRKLLYFNLNLKDNSLINHGIEFKDLTKFISTQLNNILLLKHHYPNAYCHKATNFEYITSENLPGLIRDNIYGYGDFCWVDFEDENKLDLLEPKDISELLYLGHMYQPLVTPFFKINNSFAYCAHDDGWFCLLYCREKFQFETIIVSAILLELKQLFKRRKFPPVPDTLRKNIIQLSEEGLLIDFKDLDINNPGSELPLYTIGKTRDMDDLLNNLENYKKEARSKFLLIYNKKNWSII